MLIPSKLLVKASHGPQLRRWILFTRSELFLRVLSWVRTNQYKVDLILPAEVHDAVSEQLAKTTGPPRYSRVVMSLGDVLQGDFFTEYIKKGALDCPRY
jgi:hypothetical protein